MEHNGLVLGTGNGGKVVDCELCGYAHLDPLPTVAEIDALYQDQYYQSHNAGFTHKAHESHFDEQREDLAWHKIAFREQVDALERIAPNKELLDYGAGAGWFAQYTHGLWNDWSVMAVEPSPTAREYADETVKAYMVEKLPDPTRKWGIVRASYVLEHLIDPRQALVELRERLVDDGVLCVLVPNEFNRWACKGRDKFGLDSYWIRPGLHLNYFTNDSIAGLLRDVGFEIVDQVATFPTELFMLAGFDFASDPDLGHKVHHVRMNIERTVDGLKLGRAKLAVYRRLARRGLGRASVTYARKTKGIV